MRILIDILHPAHLHRLKYFILKMQKSGDEVLVVARNKEVTFDLLKKYNIPFVDTGVLGVGKAGRIKEYFQRLYRMIKAARKFKPDVLIGGDGVTIGPVGKILRIPSVALADTEDAGLISKISFPVVDRIVTPYCFEKDLGAKQDRFNGFFELTYLNDKHFVPDISLLDKMGVAPGEVFFILRFVSWQACHDEGEEGLDLNQKRQLIAELSSHGKVLISSDGDLPEEFAKYAIRPLGMHSVLYYSSLYFGDSQTMSIEAGLLGVPSIRCNSLVLKMHARGQFTELQNKYGLVYSYSHFSEAFLKLKEILSNPQSKKEWLEKREVLIKNTVDFTDFFCDYIKEKRFLTIHKI